jgi:MYXO-CTERM domain-containing protein
MSVLVSSSVVLAGWAAAAAFQLPIMNDPHPAEIAGGQTVEPCGWPSVVLLRGNGYLCSGNLIHPEIVATAAHCLEVMADDTKVYFGNTANTAQEKVAVDFCTSSPEFVSNGDGTIAFDQVGNDWGFCKLSAPITDVEPIPPLYGCEMDLLQPGAEITRVGFGKETLATNQFFKRWVETTIVSVPFTGVNGWATQLSEGGGGEGTCPGDSGGPSFIRIPESAGGDGSWRMVAIQSTQPVEDAEGNPIECGTEPNNTAVFAQGVELVESESGIDVSPCFSPDGAWDPDFHCQGFPLEPGAGGGTWAMGCDPGPLGGFSSACGVAFDQANPDATPPSVLIVDPPGTVVEPWTGAAVPIHVLAEADDGANGWGIASVDLVIVDAATGDELGVFNDLDPAYEWEPEFPQGAFQIRAIGYDNAGFVTETETLDIYIGVDPPAGDTGDGESGDEPADDTGADDTGGATGSGVDDAGAGTSGGDTDVDGDATGAVPMDRGEAGEGNGCGCRSTRDPTRDPTRGGSSLAMLMLLVALARRRR